MPIALSLLLVLFFLLMNAFFVAAEFSLVRVRKSQVEILVDEGRKGAKYTKLVADNVNAYLSACQLGITLASLALGWLGEPAVSALFEPLFKALNVPEAATHGISIVIGFVIITALHIVVGRIGHGFLYHLQHTSPSVAGCSCGRYHRRLLPQFRQSGSI